MAESRVVGHVFLAGAHPAPVPAPEDSFSSTRGTTSVLVVEINSQLLKYYLVSY